jgi:hypothetical protein
MGWGVPKIATARRNLTNGIISLASGMPTIRFV